MELQDMERAAAMGEPMPKNISDLDWFYWQCMADLYRRYQSREIDKDTAKEEKKEIQKRYKRLAENQERLSTLYKEWQGNILSAGHLRAEMIKEPNEHKAFALALKIISAMTGEDTTEKIVFEKFLIDTLD